ncbi:ATP-GRASP peptide maturase, grasp-with-spasm system [Tenacibaculum sp. MAR_2009_124]|uniref:grasp-with-spasm system ATP-grasp peptide maturase n=1 Tax=Tenacibaculum sp. MAR_2009_124 TaxID=1250059 RepID=UPI00089D0799|nr:grasp-with-spasm system ATP-grasp peptide maturase [Tenacibaculum sp. MAR_2009_124]SEC91511.1 ATP-GRASP peptide maturase, grasp-with-spasm system [Tenacibaculum sp. MAR_2009_124]
MIIILSTHGDASTDEVCKLLTLRKAPYLRINDDLFTKDSSIGISLDNTFLRYTIKNSIYEINYHEKHVIWNRKFGFFSKTELYNESIKQFDGDILTYISSEFYGFLQMLKSTFYNSKWINPPADYNKLKQLRIAEKVKMNVPSYLITNTKNELSKFKQSEGNIITKSLKASKTIYRDEYYYPLLTYKVNDIEQLHETFLPSIFQKQIEKSYEIRVFVIDEKIFSMAIFSQKDSQTKVDFRDYNLEKPNRMIPYIIPTELQEKIIRFMNEIGLVTGSFDFIKSSSDSLYYFLEVNPSGQFGMVSYPCNYNLEEELTLYLIQENLKK